MVDSMKRKRRHTARGIWGSALLLIGLLVAWCSVLTLCFIVLFDNFLYRVSHPFDSGFSKGPWGFLLIYVLLCIPVFPLYNWVERDLRWRRLQRYKQQARADRRTRD